mmetsp:Transcript_119/g.256  ORF Transcript_119/g.256 Transcript_119/m.256 type:complete len:385 (-) Transcript_119:27-1181(-)
MSGTTTKLFKQVRSQVPDMKGKVVAITGCTSGMGYICAKACAEQGARVLMLNRPSSRADAALKALREASSAEVSLIACDLEDFESVRRAAEEIKRELADVGLDVLCNNAGIIAAGDVPTKDGCDPQMQVGHHSHFLLTAELWPLLEKAAQLRGNARVVNHSSIARFCSGWGAVYLYLGSVVAYWMTSMLYQFGLIASSLSWLFVHLGALALWYFILPLILLIPLRSRYLQNDNGKLSSKSFLFMGPRWNRYQQSKMANALFTYALHEFAAASGSTVKSLVAHPGIASTNLWGDQVDSCSWMKAASFVGFVQSPEDGSVPLLTCCSSPDVKSGEFYAPARAFSGPCRRLWVNPEGSCLHKATRKYLWEVSSSITGSTFSSDREAV